MKLILDPKHGDEIDAALSMYPSKISCYLRGTTVYLNQTDTAYGVCIEGSGVVTPEEKSGFPPINFKEGSCFTLPGSFVLTPESKLKFFKVYVIIRRGYRGMFGTTMLEKRGRLAYIDGCSDSLLFPPARLGDPCLNSLHFPPGIRQTQHLHPDIRMGVVVSGEGRAFRENHWELKLQPGAMFLLQESEIHSFKTDTSPMTVVAYHPTTDTGPTDQAHAMISRTYINHGKG